MSPKTSEEKAVNLGFMVIITFRTRSENPLLSNGGRRIMFMRLSEMPRKIAHSTTLRKKKHRNNPKLLLVLPAVARVARKTASIQVDSIRKISARTKHTNKYSTNKAPMCAKYRFCDFTA